MSRDICSVVFVFTSNSTCVVRCWRGCNFCPVPITHTLGHCRPEMAKPAASRCPFWASKFTYLDENSYNFTQVQAGVLRFNPRGVRYLFQHHGLGNQFLRVPRNGLRVAARVVSSIHCCLCTYAIAGFVLPVVFFSLFLSEVRLERRKPSFSPSYISS